jgi:hypothetical protein
VEGLDVLVLISDVDDGLIGVHRDGFVLALRWRRRFKMLMDPVPGEAHAYAGPVNYLAAHRGSRKANALTQVATETIFCYRVLLRSPVVFFLSVLLFSSPFTKHSLETRTTCVSKSRIRRQKEMHTRRVSDCTLIVKKN